jgi:hypothetical protein
MCPLFCISGRSGRLKLRFHFPFSGQVCVFCGRDQLPFEPQIARILSIDECVRGIHQLCRLSIRTVSQAIRIDIVVAQRPRLSFLTKSLLTFISLEQNEFCWNMRCRNKRSVWHDECKLRASVAKPTDQGFHRFSIRPTPTLSRLVPILGMAAGGRLVVHLEVTL